MSSPQSISGDITPKAASVPTLLMPPFLTADLFGNPRQLTPPPMASPLPRTPKPHRFHNPPRTPVAKLNTSFGGGDDFDDEGIDASMLHAGMAITRPSSSCSTYSCSSDSSVDSNTTYNSTAGGSCTSVEDEYGGYYDTPKGKAPETNYILSAAASERQVTPESKRKEKQRSGRARKTKWTESMDAHLWKTYMLYQQDPKITPFFVLPGAVPPLGVCYKVARETKRSWKDAKLNGSYTPVSTPKPRLRQRVIQPASESSNRGDSIRKMTPYTWPASEASTRRRLRELSRENYGLSRNPYHNHHQQRRGACSSADMKSRSSTLSPSPFKSSGQKMPNARDPFSTTRSMALSLTTSTATSMRPSGALASLAAGRDIHSTSAIPPRPFGGITERIESATISHLTQQNVVATGSLGLGVELSTTFKSRHGRNLSLDSNTPSLLPPLELKSSRSPYGTWPRRLKRAEHNNDDGESSTPLPPRSRARRGTLVDLFGDEPVPAVTPAPKTRARARGYTISAGTNPLGTRRRSRPGVAPLLTVTGPVSYDSPSAQEGGSPIARRERFGNIGGDSPRRLGSPFAERERE